MICNVCKEKMTCIDSFQIREKRYRAYKCKKCKNKTQTVESPVFEQADLDVFARLLRLHRQEETFRRRQNALKREMEKIKKSNE